MHLRAPAIDLQPDAAAAAIKLANKNLPALNVAVPQRPPGFCTGCPERPIFADTTVRTSTVVYFRERTRGVSLRCSLIVVRRSCVICTAIAA